MNAPRGQLEAAPEVSRDLAFETTTEYARRMMLGVVLEYEPECCPGCGVPTKHGEGKRCQECAA